MTFKATTTKTAAKAAPAKTKSSKIASLCEGKEKNLYIKFDKPVTITTYDGKKVETQYLNLEKPIVALERLLKYGVIDEATFEARSEKLADLSFLKYEVSVSVPKE